MSQTQTQTSSGVRKIISHGPVTLDNIHVNDFQKAGTKTAQIRQEVTTTAYYPSKKVASDMQANPFAAEDFGFEEQKFTSNETRVAWVLVPAHYDEAAVAQVFAEQKGGCIYRVLSNEPILDENQLYAVANNIRTKDQFANKQVVRVPENDETLADGTAGKLLLDLKKNVQYRRTFYWNVERADIDQRDPSKTYLTPELEAEFTGAGASVVAGQTV